MLKNTMTSYGSVTKFFHWIIFILVLFMLIYGYCLEYVPEEYQGFAYNIHKLTGLLILALMILRVLWSWMNPKPKLPFNTSSLQKISAYTVHWLLNIALIVMPLAGWIGSSASGRAPHLGSFSFTFPVPQEKSISSLFFDIHNNVAIILIVLISLHVIAAIYHHFIKRDNVLVRILPGSRTI